MCHSSCRVSALVDGTTGTASSLPGQRFPPQWPIDDLVVLINIKDGVGWVSITGAFYPS
jgi:hypothetical protein